MEDGEDGEPTQPEQGENRLLTLTEMLQEQDIQDDEETHAADEERFHHRFDIENLFRNWYPPATP
jgi:hypothetical protein